jgi:hypothetical protein
MCTLGSVDCDWISFRALTHASSRRGGSIRVEARKLGVDRAVADVRKKMFALKIPVSVRRLRVVGILAKGTGPMHALNQFRSSLGGLWSTPSKTK